MNMLLSNSQPKCSISMWANIRWSAGNWLYTNGGIISIISLLPINWLYNAVLFRACLFSLSILLVCPLCMYVRTLVHNVCICMSTIGQTENNRLNLLTSCTINSKKSLRITRHDTIRYLLQRIYISVISN